jgi:YjbE family integral membrane protein
MVPHRTEASPKIECPLDPTFLLQILQIIWINILLSGDNAVVIALACRSLPSKERTWGVVLGAGAAVLMRILFTVMVMELMQVPYLKLFGGLLLLWIAVKLVIDDTDEADIHASSTIWNAVRTIAVADMVMSLDNVVAIAAAAKGSLPLIVFGLLISVPLIVFGATLIITVLQRFPILVWAGAGLLGWVAGELIAGDPSMHPLTGSLSESAVEIAGGVICTVLVLGVAYVLKQRQPAADNVT